MAKWLFPRMRPDEGVKRLNTIILVVLFTLFTAGLAVAVIMIRYNQIGK
jgi:hypothetical protein